MRWCHALPCANGGRPSLTELSYASPALRECQMRVHVVARYHQTQGGIATTALRVFGKTQKKALGHSQPSPLQRPLLAKLGLRRGESGGPESLGRERTCFPVARCLLAHELHGKEAVDFTTRRLRTQSPFSALTILLLCHEWLLPFHKNEIVFPAAGSQPMVIILGYVLCRCKKNKISQDPCTVAVARACLVFYGFPHTMVSATEEKVRVSCRVLIRQTNGRIRCAPSFFDVTKGRRLPAPSH